MDETVRLLGIDVGGTKTLFSLYERRGTGELVQTARQVIPSRPGMDLSAQVKVFLAVNGNSAGRERTAVGFCLAGPIRAGVCDMPNLDLRIDLEVLRRELEPYPVAFCNDVQAMGYALDTLRGDELVPFCGPETTFAPGDRVVIAAGTGLGMAFVPKEGTAVHPSEGAHADFAPDTEREWELKRSLLRQYSHVSWERVLSGPGLAEIHCFLSGAEEPAAPEDIAAVARQGDAAAKESFHLFSKILGRYCSDAALTYLAYGGIYLGGGFLLAVRDLIDRNAFFAAYGRKGRFTELVQGISVWLIAKKEAAAQGAAVLAGGLLRQGDR